MPGTDSARPQANGCSEPRSAGFPERVAIKAMKMTGHETRSVFERYNIVSGGDFVDAARRLTAWGQVFRHRGQPRGQSARMS
jgi:hypothetical protein